MCAKMCPGDEECRYDIIHGNYEYHGYKCHNPNYSKIMIWAPIYVAVAGTVIIGLLIFFVVRYFKNKAQIRKTINKEKQPDNEVPYQYTIDRDDTQNESVGVRVSGCDSSVYVVATQRVVSIPPTKAAILKLWITT